MAKIVVLYDSWSKADAKKIWEEMLRDNLGSDYSKHNIVYVENRAGAFKWSTEVRENVKEAFGDPEFIKESIKDAEVVLSGFAPMTASIMDASPALKVIGIARGGPVNVDVASATARGVMLIGTVGRNAISVADQTMGLILSESRHIARLSMALKTGTYFTDVNKLGRKYLEGYAFQELESKTLGLIGFGEVGRRVAKRAHSFDMKVQVFDPYITTEALMKDECTKTELEPLLRTSDFISIHAKLTPETTHMLNKERLDLMKPSAVIVNTARGEIIDEKALYEALMEKRIAGAALDVFEEDPVKPDNLLLKLDNVTATPHTAGRSPEVERRGYQQVAEATAKYLWGEEIRRAQIANPKVLER
ncbi:MAG: NAD(P)-dependent oxidoreductase [Candidatus Bathyarchaeia archaeon]|jgi:D-3-phosphoglycerate dehydrogenase